MKNDPVVIPDDILAKYEGQEKQFEVFDAAFKTVMNVPSSSVPSLTPSEPVQGAGPKRGRPKKQGL